MSTLYDAAVLYDSAITYDGLVVELPTPSPFVTGTYQLRAVQMDGTIISILRNANLHRVSYQLNRPGSIEFSIDQDKIVESRVKRYTEIQVWRDDVCIWWGVVVLAQQDSDSRRVVFNCQGLLWYFYRRFVGKADRTNWLDPYANFEGGTTGWTAFGTTFTVDGAHKIIGNQSAKLVQATEDTDTFIQRSVSITSGGVGDLMTVVGYYYIEPGSWVGPARSNRGLFIEQRVGNNVYDPRWADIDDEPVIGAWERLETETHMPPNVTRDIGVRCYSPACRIRWGGLSLTKMESLSNYNTDQAEVFRRLAVHLQDSAYNKSNLFINPNTPATGVAYDWHRQFAEHPNGGRTMEEFAERDNGLDYSITWDAPGKQRFINTHFPRKGELKTKLQLHSNNGKGNIKSYKISDDGEDGISSLTILGEEDGPDREEGAAIDAAAFGGLILEDVESAPPGTGIDFLDRVAVEKLRVRKNPRRINLTVKNTERRLIGFLDVGDTIPITIDDGWAQVSGNWRVISLTIAPHSEEVSLELNAA